MNGLARTVPWWLAVAALIAMAGWLQLDLLSQESPGLVRLVPVPFQSRAMSERAIKAIEDNDWPAARSAAAKAVVRQPMPAAVLATLSLATSQGGAQTDERSLAILGAAAGRGWRDSLAQAGGLGLALDAGQFDAAALRLDALWRIQAVGPATEPVIDAAFAEPRFRAAFARRFAAGAPWQSDMVKWAVTNAAPADFVDFMTHAIGDGATPDCQVLGSAATSAIQAGKPDFVRGVWRRFCHSAGSDGFRDWGSQDHVAGPFDWTYPADAGLTSTITARGAIQYQAAGLVRITVARRWADLQPGDHALRLQYVGRNPVLRVTCYADGQRGDEILSTFSAGVAEFTLSDGCSTQSLGIEVETGDGAVSSPTLR